MNRLSTGPHPIALFSTYNSRYLTNDIAKYLNVPLGKTKDKPFADGETFVQIKDDIRGRDVFIVCSIGRSWLCKQDDRPYTGVNDNLMELLVFCDAAARASAWRITAVIPYLGYARQDRKSQSRTPITARLVASMLEAAGINRILTMDLHTEQIQGFFSAACILDHLNAGQLFSDFFTAEKIDNGVVLSPDVGNLKKADKYRQGMPLNIDLAVIDKRRDEDGNVSAERLIGEVEGKTVILTDDMISTAGTMRSSIDFCLKRGAKDFIIGATHWVCADKAIEKLTHPKIKKIVVTDTLPPVKGQESLPIITLHTGDIFGEAIRRIHCNQSISELLGKFG